MRVLSLFSGIGAFDLGLARAGMHTVAFCECDAFCRRVLARHWPGVPCYDDVRTLTGDRLRADGIAADVIAGGFPCQPFSSASAGKQRGQSDDRYLWPDMLRLVAEVRPAWVCAENVAHIGRLALAKVVSDLEGCGYKVASLVIPACAIGHDHRRDRVWFLAHTDSDHEPVRTVDAEVAGCAEPRAYAGSNRAPDGPAGRMERLRALGNALVPQIPEMIGRAIMANSSKHPF